MTISYLSYAGKGGLFGWLTAEKILMPTSQPVDRCMRGYQLLFRKASQKKSSILQPTSSTNNTLHPESFLETSVLIPSLETCQI